MDYKGIITRGYHVDAGGQIAISIISQGYTESLASIALILNVVRGAAYFQMKQICDIMFGKKQSGEVRFQIKKKDDTLF